MDSPTPNLELGLAPPRIVQDEQVIDETRTTREERRNHFLSFFRRFSGPRTVQGKAEDDGGQVNLELCLSVKPSEVKVERDSNIYQVPTALK